MIQYPRLYARYRTDQPIELMRGHDITDSALLNIAAEMGEGWDVWRDDGMRDPVGAHTGRIMATRESSLALSKAELRDMDQGDEPFSFTGRFGKQAREPERFPVMEVAT